MKYKCVAVDSNRAAGQLCDGCVARSEFSAIVKVCDNFIAARVAEGLPHCFDNYNIIYVEDKNEVHS